MMAWCGLGVVGQADGLPAWLAATEPVVTGGMLDLIPAFDWQKVVVAPWTVDIGLYGWMMLMAFLVTTACGLIGNYLLLRRLALVGDAISHSVLPGLVAGFLIFGSLGIGPMLVGAVLAGVLTTVLIELIHSHSRVKADAAIGITFCSLFALGVLLINVYAGQVHLDAECVLYGELSYVPFATEQVYVLGVKTPLPVVVMGVATGIVVLLTGLFYKELLISSFDAGLAAAFGFRPRVIHYTLMAMLSLVVVAAFESVGAILVIAMLILPGATAQLLSTRLPVCFGLSVAHAALSSVLGVHLGLWLGCSLAAAVVVAGTGLFGLAWGVSLMGRRRVEIEFGSA
jgi:manganese/zinc/iron transport system permease protein